MWSEDTSAGPVVGTSGEVLEGGSGWTRALCGGLC